jgi:hypothetical protein
MTVLISGKAPAVMGLSAAKRDRGGGLGATESVENRGKAGKGGMDEGVCWRKRCPKPSATIILKRCLAPG